MHIVTSVPMVSERFVALVILEEESKVKLCHATAFYMSWVAAMRELVEWSAGLVAEFEGGGVGEEEGGVAVPQENGEGRANGESMVNRDGDGRADGVAGPRLNGW